MEATINGQRYNTDRCKEVARFHHYNNGNYSGDTSLIEAKNGKLLIWRDTNGQDCFLQDDLIAYSDSKYTINDFDSLIDEKRLVKLGLIEIV